VKEAVAVALRPLSFGTVFVGPGVRRDDAGVALRPFCLWRCSWVPAFAGMTRLW
jgi:hypothetical protein